MMINYHTLQKAITLYSDLGYNLIEVPWTVSLPYVQVTAPPHVKYYETEPGQFLVASAEQSFLSLFDNGKIEANVLYQAITPCFRHEIVQDALHLPYFMKLELFFAGANLYEKMIADAKFVMTTLGANPYKKDCSHVGHCSFDLEHHGVELGSYGYRHACLPHKSVNWTYGTGLAEPRFTQVTSL